MRNSNGDDEGLKRKCANHTEVYLLVNVLSLAKSRIDSMFMRIAHVYV